MCVIFYQTKKDKLMTKEEFCWMANKNPDGMGWMANIGGKIHYQKGYFNVNDFYKDYLKIKKNPKTIDIACHFRIGTGSKCDKANCHPFPITKNEAYIKREKGVGDVMIMMNGIIGRSTLEFSDTALYTMNKLTKYYNQDKRFFLHLTRTQEMLFENEISGNRFVFMSKDGSKLFGKGWSDYEGKAKVSNRYFIPYKPKATTKTYMLENGQKLYYDANLDEYFVAN